MRGILKCIVSATDSKIGIQGVPLCLRTFVVNVFQHRRIGALECVLADILQTFRNINGLQVVAIKNVSISISQSDFESATFRREEQ